MKRYSTPLFIVILALLAFALGFNYFKQPFLQGYNEAKKQAIEEGYAPAVPTLTPKETLFESMSPREKISQVLAFPITLEESEQNDWTQETQQRLSWISENHPGFVTLFGKNISFTSAEKGISTIYDRSSQYDIPPLIAVDHEGGSVQRLNGEGFTVLPSWNEVCRTDPAENKRVFEKSAYELQRVGVDIVFAPVLDLGENQAILQSRVCGDYVTTLERAQDYILAFSAQKVMPVVKHFPGIGSIRFDLHGRFEDVDLTAQDTQAFKDILDRFPNIGLMTTHVGITGILEETPCSLSEVCLGKLTGLYPETLFVTDALEMDSARYQPNTAEEKSLADVSKEAILAGNNMLVFGEDVSLEELDGILKSLEIEYTQSEVFRKKLDMSVAKILLLKKVEKLP